MNLLFTNNITPSSIYLNTFVKISAALVSRSLPSDRLSETLSELNSVAARGCYITWRTERSDGYESEVARVTGKQPRLYPDYCIIYETALSMGFSAGLEIFESTNEERFPTLQEAVISMSRGAELTEARKAQLTEVAINRLKVKDNTFCSTYKMKWSLIYWRKPVT